MTFLGFFYQAIFDPAVKHQSPLLLLSGIYDLFSSAAHRQSCPGTPLQIKMWQKWAAATLIMWTGMLVGGLETQSGSPAGDWCTRPLCVTLENTLGCFSSVLFPHMLLVLCVALFETQKRMSRGQLSRSEQKWLKHLDVNIFSSVEQKLWKMAYAIFMKWFFPFDCRLLSVL